MKTLLKKAGKNKFVQGGAILVVANTIASFINYLFNSFAGKALGPEGFGEIAALFAYFNILSIPMLIVTTVIVRRLGQAGPLRNLVAKTFESWFLKKSRKFILLIPFLYVFVFILPDLTNLSTISVITLITLTVINFFAILYLALLQGLHLFIAFSIATLIIALLKLTGALGAYFNLGGITLIYTFVLVGSFAPILYGKWSLDKISYIPKPDVYTFNKKLRDIIMRKHVVITAISLLSITALSNIDIVFAKKIFSAQDAGLYSAWALFAKIVLYFIGPLNMISLIFFSAKETSHRRKSTMKGIIGMLFLIGVMLFTTYVFLGDLLIRIIFNSDFLAIKPLLGKAALFGIVYTYLTLLNNYFVAQSSKNSLIIAWSIPFYILGLVLFGTSIETMITVNLVVSSATLGLYFFKFARS